MVTSRGTGAIYLSCSPCWGKLSPGVTSPPTLSALPGLHSTLSAYMYRIRTCTEYGLFLPYMTERNTVWGPGLAWHVVVSSTPGASHEVSGREARCQQNHITTSAYAYASETLLSHASRTRGWKTPMPCRYQVAPLPGDWQHTGGDLPCLRGLDWRGRIFSVIDRPYFCTGPPYFPYF